MPSSLAELEIRFNARLNWLDSAFDRSVVNRNSASRSDRCFLQEGLISTLWQAWSFAVRSVVFHSVRGTATKSGLVTTSPYAALPEPELAYIASRLARNQPIGAIKPITGSHLEPTWGDLNKIALIAGGYNLNNGTILSASLASPSSLKDLQTCRNCCAHLSSDRIVDLKMARIRYSSTNYMHPSDMIFWVDPSTSNFLWQTWTDDMRIAFALACS